MMSAKDLVKRKDYYPQAVCHYFEKWSKGNRRFVRIYNIYTDNELSPFTACKKVLGSSSSEYGAWIEALKAVQSSGKTQ